MSTDRKARRGFNIRLTKVCLKVGETEGITTIKNCPQQLFRFWRKCMHVYCNGDGTISHRTPLLTIIDDVAGRRSLHGATLVGLNDGRDAAFQALATGGGAACTATLASRRRAAHLVGKVAGDAGNKAAQLLG